MDLGSAFDIEAATWTPKGGLVPVTAEEWLSAGKKSVGVTWIALKVKDPDLARKSLEHDFGFHPVAIEDAISDTERPGMFTHEDYVFATLPVLESRDEKQIYTHVGLFVCDSAVVSVTTWGCRFIDEWFNRWTSHPAEVGPRSDTLMEELIDAAVDDYFPALDAIQDEVDTLEESVYSGRKFEVGSAVRLRRNLLEMRRQVTPIRDILNGLMRRDTPIIRQETRAYLQDVYDHALRVLESIDLNRDILTSIMDAQLSVQSNRLNEVMKNMTSLATVLMMMALITGIYGMNFKHMPELEWKYGYYFVWLLLAIVFFGGLGVANKIGWLTVNWPWDKKEPDSS